MIPRYFSVQAPASWTKSGTTRVTVRTGGAYDAYLCIGNDRVGITAEQAWALWAALGQALPATFGPVPEWLTAQTTDNADQAGRG